MSTQPRRPAAFRPNDPKVVIAETDAPHERDLIELNVDRAGGALTVPPAVALTRPRKRWPWATMFWSAVGGLTSLALGLAATQLVEALFARNDVLGWIGVGLTAIATLALLVIAGREAYGLFRLSAVESLRERALAAIASDDRNEAIAVAQSLLDLLRNAPPLARARKTLSSHLGDIIDGADLVRLTERHLMAPLDDEAKRLVSAAAKRVSIVTAVSPRALVDIAFVLVTAFGLMRRLAYLYGARPGTIGLLRLMRLCIAHLTVTGGIAIGDSMVQQILGHGLAAKLSTRLGEGMLNGLLTARLGLAAIEVTRPMPFAALPRPAITDLASDLLRTRDKSDKSASNE